MKFVGVLMVVLLCTQLEYGKFPVRIVRKGYFALAVTPDEVS